MLLISLILLTYHDFPNLFEAEIVIDPGRERTISCPPSFTSISSMSPSSQQTTEFDLLPYSAHKSLSPFPLEIEEQIKDTVRSVIARSMALAENRKPVLHYIISSGLVLGN